MNDCVNGDLANRHRKLCDDLFAKTVILSQLVYDDLRRVDA